MFVWRMPKEWRTKGGGSVVKNAIRCPMGPLSVQSK